MKGSGDGQPRVITRISSGVHAAAGGHQRVGTTHVAAGYASADGTETVKAYDCAPGCPVAELDRQSGTLKSGAKKPHHVCHVPKMGHGRVYGGFANSWERKTFAADTGGASRFFPVLDYGPDDKLPEAPFLYYAKAARSEREVGCEGLPARSGAEAVDRDDGNAGAQSPRAGAETTASEIRNHHPTVKPLSVMRWLCRLVTAPGGIVLDPFMGSGTTGVAALLEGFNFVGCELQPEYMAIAKARIGHAEGEVEPLLRVRS